MSFDKFNSFPLEIRREVWKWSIPTAPAKNEWEICCWGAHTKTHHSHEEHPVHDPKSLIVDIPFPEIMYVCRESRELVMDSKASGVFFCASPAANCMVPFRHFCPGRDVLQFTFEEWYVFQSLKDEPFVSQIRLVTFLYQSYTLMGPPMPVYIVSRPTSSIEPDGNNVTAVSEQGHGNQEESQNAEYNPQNDGVISLSELIFDHAGLKRLRRPRGYIISGENYLSLCTTFIVVFKVGTMTQVELANKPTSIVFDGRRWPVHDYHDTEYSSCPVTDFLWGRVLSIFNV
ncbi:hypothetical protein E4U55_002454 [Claviceps digitariae]|nr:hypothetical protein E4U55_002454 [Claviceps digitariae]